jgi:type IX secretion system PorP/SprF family membrane protein
MLRKKMLRLFLMLIISSKLNAQDVHYSQIANFGLFYNPAHTGNFNGNSRAMAIFRNQNIAVANTPVTGVYNSYGASFDTKIFKEYTGDNTWSVGILFNGDHAGEGTLSTHDVSIATSYKLALDRYGSSFLSAGIQGGFTSKRLFSQDLIFGNQVEGFEFNPQVPNFETFLDGRTQIQANFNLGVLWQQKVNDGFGYQMGFAIYNLNSPNQFFYENSNSNVYKRYVVHAGTEFFADETLVISPSIVYMKQGPATQTNVSMIVKKNVNEYLNVVGGLRYRIKDAFILQAGVEYQKYRVSVSYDFTVSGLSSANKTQGAFELSFGYIFGDETEVSLSGKQFCPTF